MNTILKSGSYLIAIAVICFSCTSSERGWVDLLEGDNLDQWHTYGKGKNFNGWTVKNGILEFNQGPGTELGANNLVTDSIFTNFELSLEWMISSRGNAGLFWSVVEEDQYEHAYVTGPEIQILDDRWTEYIEERGDVTRAGALYNLLPPSEVVSRPANIWNKYLLHIDHQENVGFLVFNDKEVLRFPVHGPEWESMIADSGFGDNSAFGRSESGRIGLQEWGSKVTFRNVKIRKLP